MSADARGMEPAGTDPCQGIGERLAACYRTIHATAMRDVPICNEALGVAAVGFRAYGERAVGIVVTPWFINLVAVPLRGERPDAARLRLPAGEVEMAQSDLPGFGRIASCSLFSPVMEFVDMAAALATAQAALAALFEPPAPEVPRTGAIGRRALLRGDFAGRGSGSETAPGGAP